MPSGNYITYHYTNPFSKSLCISEIKFSANTNGLAPLNSIKFNYKLAKRSESAYLKGVKIEKVALLDFVDVTTNGQLFRKYKLTHTADTQLAYEKLTKIEEFNGALEAANPVVLEYRNTVSTAANSEKKITYTNNLDFTDIDVSGDFDGDGHLDFATTGQLYTKMFQGSAGTAPIAITNRGTEGLFAATTVSNSKLNQFQSLVTRNARYASQIRFDVYNLVTSALTLSYNKTFAAFNDNLIYNTLPYEVHTTEFVTEQEAISRGLTTVNVDLHTTTNGPLSNDNYLLVKQFLEGDFDGNGISEVLLLQPTIEYQTRITDYKLNVQPYTNIAKLTDTFIKKSSVTHAYLVDLNPTESVTQGTKGYVKLNNDNYILDGEKRVVADFNSDGKSDILIVNSNKAYKIITFKQLAAAPWVEIEIIGSGTLDAYTKAKQLLVGDYNGDGKTDIMLPDTEGGSGHTLWHIYYSNPNPAGGEYFVKESHNIVEYWPDTQNTYQQRQLSSYYALDTNSDGKTDMVRVWLKKYQPDEVFDARNYDTQWIVTSFVNNIGNTNVTGNKFTPDYVSPCSGSVIPNCNHNDDSPDLPFPVVSNYKYNGANTELLMVRNHHNELTYINFTKDVGQDILLNKVTSAGGIIVDNITYSPMEPSTANNGLGNLSDFYSSQDGVTYPNVEIKRLPSNYLVSLLTNTIDGVSKSQDFRYNGMVANLNGLGTFGFRKIARSAWYTSPTAKRTWSITENNMSYRGAPQRTYTQLVNTGNAFAFVATGNPAGIINSNVNLFTSLTSAGIYKLLLSTQTVNDYITGVTTVTRYQYDPTYSLPTVVTTQNLLGSVIQGVRTVTTTYINNATGTGAAYYIGRPATTKTLESAYSDTFETSQKYTYLNNKLSKLEKKGNTTSTIYQTEEYEYDVYGNIIKKTLSIPGATPVVVPRIVEYTYDPTGRFLKTEKDIEGSLITNNTYHPLYGLVTSSTNPFGLNTLTTYDNWGKLTKVTDFLGKNINYSYSKSGSEYTTTKTGDDGSSSTVKCDVLGRTKKTGVKNIDDTWSYKDTEYDFLGRKYRESEPYSSGTPTLWNTDTYDDYNRVLSSTTGTGKITNIVYAGLTVTATEGYKTSSSTKNANGHVVSATDNGGTITYVYYANGNIKETNYIDTSITMKYNEWGVKTELIDPSAGTYTYSYYPTGEVKDETTPNGTTAYTYDAVGKLLTKTIVGTNTNTVSSYSYDPTTKLITSSTFIDNLDAQATTTNTYEYSPSNKRLIKTTEVTPYATFVKQLTLDGFGRVATEKSTATVNASGKTSSKTVTNTYKNGLPWQILDGATVLWQSNNVNSRGQLTSATLGNGIAITNTYDTYGYVTKMQHDLGTTNVMKLETLFDAPRGNLRNRKNSLFNSNIEEFEYDALDRLTVIRKNEQFLNNTFSTSDTEGYQAQGGAVVNSSSGWLSAQTTTSGSGIKKELLTGAVIGDVIIINFDVNRIMGGDVLNVYIDEQDPVTGTVVRYLEAIINTSTSVYISHHVTQYTNISLKIEKSTTTSLNVFIIDNVTAVRKFDAIQEYDDRGRITENEIGSYNYSITGKAYQNSSVTLNSKALAYYQGRQTQNISYNTFKSPYQIEDVGIDKISFTYNDDNNRSSMFYGSTNTNKKLRPMRKDFSADGSMEIKVTSTAVEFITYIGGDGYTAPIVLKSDGTTQNYLYLHRDYQGSIVAITNNAGAIVEKRLFDAWGEIVKVQDGVGNTLTRLTVLDRGYTGHEHLQSVGLVHMNGRLYDPKLHRFLQPDNNIQEPYNTQNYNRYGYCLNNPLKYTDPSGELFGLDDLAAAVIIGAIISATTYTLMAVTGHSSFNIGGLAKATFIGALSGAVTFGIGDMVADISNFYLRAGVQALMHGEFQGMMAGVQGGNFWSGFSSGALSSIATSAWQGGGSESNFKGAGKFASSGVGMIGFGTVMGGAGAELSGGNFWQGAVTGLYVSALNHFAHSNKEEWGEATIEVTDEIVGETTIHGYPYSDGSTYKTPLYKVIVSGKDADGNVISKEFKAIRFGVKVKSDGLKKTVFLAAGSYTIKDFLANYCYNTGGFWIKGDYLIHLSSVNSADGNNGCIAIAGGKAVWTQFKEYIAKLTFNSDLSGAARAGSIKLTIEPAKTPKLY